MGFYNPNGDADLHVQANGQGCQIYNSVYREFLPNILSASITNFCQAQLPPRSRQTPILGRCRLASSLADITPSLRSAKTGDATAFAPWPITEPHDVPRAATTWGYQMAWLKF